MRRYSYIGVLMLLLILGCEEVIEVDTPTEAPRLVVDGIIRVDTTQEFLPVAIKLSETNNFFSAIKPVSAVESFVIILQFEKDGNPAGTRTCSLTEITPGSGIYEPDPSFDTDQRILVDTILEYDTFFTMVITYNGRRYAAQTHYVPAVPINEVLLGENVLFNTEETEVVVRYTDMPDVDNYYIFDFGSGNFLPTEDTFYKGQDFEFSYFYDELFEPEKEVEVKLLGADQALYNYMNLLIQQEGNQNGPFGTPVATVRGNVFEVTHLDNNQIFDNTGDPLAFPLGYFAVVQEFSYTLVVPKTD